MDRRKMEENMKAEIITEQKKDFKPFTVAITAETIENARLLYHLCNNARLNTLLTNDDGYWDTCYSNDFSETINYSIGSMLFLDKNGKKKVKKYLSQWIMGI